MDREEIRRLALRLRRFLVTGLIVIAPIFVTVMVLLWLFTTLDDILGRYLRPLIGRELPGLGLVALVVLLLVVGWVSHRALGQRFVSWGNEILSRFPLTRRIYNASSQIVQSVLDRDEKIFQGVALIEYPMPGSYAIVFITATAPDEVRDMIGDDSLSLFLPTVPNPATGWLLMLSASKVRRLDMTVEEAFKLLLSAGFAAPGKEAAPSVGIDVTRLLRRRGLVAEDRSVEHFRPRTGDNPAEPPRPRPAAEPDEPRRPGPGEPSRESSES